MTTQESLAKKIENLKSVELIGTDEGTHNHPETVRIYRRIDGTRFASYYHAGNWISDGPADTAESKHGRIRYGHGDLVERIEELRGAREELADLQKKQSADAAYREQLARGWDGYRFIGVEEGRKKLAAM